MKRIRRKAAMLQSCLPVQSQTVFSSKSPAMNKLINPSEVFSQSTKLKDRTMIYMV